FTSNWVVVIKTLLNNIAIGRPFSQNPKSFGYKLVVHSNSHIPIILGRPFLSTSNAHINCRNGLMQLSFGNMTLELNKFNICKQPANKEDVDKEVYMIETIVQNCFNSSFSSDPLQFSLVNGIVILHKILKYNFFVLCWIPKYEELPTVSDETTSSREKAPRCELKPLPAGLKYAFLGEDETYPMVISSKLELLHEGYYQIEISLEDQEKTTFTCPFGTFASRKIPFGEMPIHGHIWHSTWTHYFSQIDLIANLPIPKTVEEIRSFLGHACFYRIFIQNFSAVARPLNNLLEKDAKFDWNYACQEAFEKLIKLLTSTPVMQPPDWSMPF
ncbi:hypothetical protein Prudu_1505S000200, partial [Prunus dulcis]